MMNWESPDSSPLVRSLLQLLFVRWYEKIYSKGGGQMTVRFDDTEENKIEQLADTAEILLEEDDARKDLKEKRGIKKRTLYDGSHKLKHLIPKGKHF